MLAALQASRLPWAPASRPGQGSRASSLQLIVRQSQLRRVRDGTARQRAGAVAILGETAQLQPILLAIEALDDLQHAVSAAAGLALHAGTAVAPPPLPSHVPLPGVWAFLADLATALQPSCFDAECQREKDMLLEARCGTTTTEAVGN